MKEQLEQRFKELKAEFESGQKMLVDLETRKTDLQNTLLRISGAIQVLEELLGQEENPEEGPARQLKEINTDGAESSRQHAEGLVPGE